MDTFGSRFAGPAGFGTGSFSRLRGLPVNVCRLVTTVASLAAVFALASSAAAAVRVVASIKPVHSLVAAVMLGAGETETHHRGSDLPP